MQSRVRVNTWCERQWAEVLPKRMILRCLGCPNVVWASYPASLGPNNVRMRTGLVDCIVLLCGTSGRCEWNTDGLISIFTSITFFNSLYFDSIYLTYIWCYSIYFKLILFYINLILVKKYIRLIPIDFGYMMLTCRCAHVELRKGSAANRFLWQCLASIWYHCWRGKSTRRRHLLAKQQRRNQKIIRSQENWD